jgi:acyl-CoA synthetase (AMP-forming)/AMP-acid ligase II
VALPCNEQLRAGDLRGRLALATPRVVVCDERNLSELSAAGWSGETVIAPDPKLITFTSGTTGEAKGIVHGQRYLPGQGLQAEHWLDARPGDLVWCTAASGWSKSARNVFIAPWLRGASALLHDARFNEFERLAILASERVNVLCMAPTEYRVIAKRAELAPLPALRGLVAAGEALNPEVLRVFAEGTGLEIRDGYGQTETGQLTGMPIGEPVRPGSMGKRSRAWTCRFRATSSCWRIRAAIRRSSCAISTSTRPPSTSRGAPATGCVRTRTDISTSRDVPMT